MQAGCCWPGGGAGRRRRHGQGRHRRGAAGLDRVCAADPDRGAALAPLAVVGQGRGGRAGGGSAGGAGGGGAGGGRGLARLASRYLPGGLAAARTATVVVTTWP